MVDLRLGNCLEVMKEIPNGSIDAIITDPPYGTTACKWDSVIDFKLMWEHLNRIIKPNGAIVLFGSEPFSSALRMSNIKNYKYDWIWYKNLRTGFANAKYMPMKAFENILVFADGKTTYNPQKVKRTTKKSDTKKTNFGDVYGNLKNNTKPDNQTDFVNPHNVINFIKSIHGTQKRSHPTQKPISLMEYLIKTYTNENETVLDFTMGSGSTMVACQNINRNGIGIEMDENYFEIAKKRIEDNKLKLF